MFPVSVISQEPSVHSMQLGAVPASHAAFPGWLAVVGDGRSRNRNRRRTGKWADRVDSRIFVDGGGDDILFFLVNNCCGAT
tara:strand:- start:351 stop:593 length:243 start_codon:yes stop_codon:yes gene_type:complete